MSYQLMAAWLNHTSSPQGSWSGLGLGLSMALDVGIHRQKTYASMTPVEAEHWRRAFWYDWCSVMQFYY